MNISFIDKNHCCGCAACQQVCPRQCIGMQADNEGFAYPHINHSQCIDCGKCLKACPAHNPMPVREPTEALAAVSGDDAERMRCSSGGIFPLLARRVISGGGMVAGAAFDEGWQVRHVCVDKAEDIVRLSGSKYVQSDMSGVFARCAEALGQGHRVLFSGMPCQVAALSRYMATVMPGVFGDGKTPSSADGKQPFTEDAVLPVKDNLTLVECLCHGVPGPGVWHRYLEERRKGREISGISFRDKSSGWLTYGFRMSFSDGTEDNSNAFLLGFVRNIYLRPSCRRCLYRGGRCHSDVALGDYWGVQRVQPDMFDNRGTGLVLVNTAAGKALTDSMEGVRLAPACMDVARRNNGAFHPETPFSPLRQRFFDSINSGQPVYDTILRLTRPPLRKRVTRAIRRRLKL